MILNYNGVNKYLYINKTEIHKFKDHDNIHWHEFYLGIVSKDFIKDEQSEISSYSTIYGFSVDHSSIENKNVLNIYEYLMVKNNIK